MCVLSCFNCILLFVTLWTVARQAPLSMGILQARIPEQGAMSSFRGSSQPRDRTHVSRVSCIAGGFFFFFFFTAQPLEKPLRSLRSSNSYKVVGGQELAGRRGESVFTGDRGSVLQGE